MGKTLQLGRKKTEWLYIDVIFIYFTRIHLAAQALCVSAKRKCSSSYFFMSSVQFNDTIYTHTHTHTTFTRVPWQKGNWDILGRLSQCHILTEMFLLSTQTIVQILISSPRVSDDIWIGRGVTWQSDVTPILATIVGLFVMAGFQNQQIRLLSATNQITEELFQ